MTGGSKLKFDINKRVEFSDHFYISRKPGEINKIWIVNTLNGKNLFMRDSYFFSNFLPNFLEPDSRWIENALFALENDQRNFRFSLTQDIEASIFCSNFGALFLDIRQYFKGRAPNESGKFSFFLEKKQKKLFYNRLFY